MDARTVKFGLRVLANKALRRHRPYIVQLTLLNQCNFSCGYCYAEYYKRGGKRMSLEQVKHVLDELHRAGTFRVNLVGGEPLLRNDIGEIVDYGNARGLMMVMNANGAFVRQRLDVVRRLYSFCISLDGDERSNDLNRGQGAFRQAMDGLHACREAGIPVNLSAVLTKHSCDQVDTMVEMARRYGGCVDFTTLISQEREGNANNASLAPSEAQVRAALERILHHIHEGAPIGFTARAYEHALRWPDYATPFVQGANPPFNDIECFAGRDYIFIDYNGDLYPCPQQVGLMRHGNIFHDGFAEAYRVASSHECMTCPQPCTTDLSLFFALKPAALAGKYRHSRARIEPRDAP